MPLSWPPSAPVLRASRRSIIRVRSRKGGGSEFLWGFSAAGCLEAIAAGCVTNGRRRCFNSGRRFKPRKFEIIFWCCEGDDMTKRDLIDEVNERFPHLSRRDSEVIINAIFDSMVDALSQGDRIEIRGFGSFVVKHRRAPGAQPQERSVGFRGRQKSAFLQGRQIAASQSRRQALRSERRRRR